MSDPGPRQEAEKAKLSGNRRGVGWVHSTGETLEQSRAERGRVVWKLDRLDRSLAHLIEVVTALEQRGVGFRSITEAIDTTTPGGRLVFHLFGALGQFERDLIRERTRAGLTAAAARGRKRGRKPVTDAERLARARSMIGKGLTVRETATRLRVGKTALYDALRADATKGDT